MLREELTEKGPVLREKLFVIIEKLRSINANFEYAYDTYVQQYGKDVIAINEPLDISGATDPVTFVLGRSCSIFYHNSRLEVKGDLGSINLHPETICLVGRREPQDSKLVAWNLTEEVELAEYNHRAGIIPSRLHCAFIAEKSDVYFTDLTSSSGTVVIGEANGEPFVRIYDPSPRGRPLIRLERINTARKA